MKRKPPSLDKPYRKHRPLLEEEAALWREAMETVPEALPFSEKAKSAREIKKPQPVDLSGAPAPKRKSNLTPERMDSRTYGEIRKGKRAVEVTLDLHGFTRMTAHEALVRFLFGAQKRGVRLALIITGKGKGGKGGILREELPRWMSESPLRECIIAYDSAGPRHGAEGAWYVRIRRIKP